ncbi:hypothetical protein P344_05120 [Spiroplasma mirum ATCC 29335]|uniref:Uncharacterized protein n=1 Tax=Spiroplasma mirum ATCC 29335 TaxID=838561 RepID=W0GRI4_9MOLU|nr:hypothetical protein [Spiroplasma mirum]AHF61244.1 truncated aminotransferase [Spiroplasma mirum ATCC 29335]AHI58346.1 hypothetical protein P344_05120 [Spiroplasma mirum ATCC 29335]
MKYNFDEIVDRSGTYDHDRKWNIEYLMQTYQINPPKKNIPRGLVILILNVPSRLWMLLKNE